MKSMPRVTNVGNGLTERKKREPRRVVVGRPLIKMRALYILANHE
jgi:hypothetical protein